jgi:hypothetical protein
MPIPNPRSGEQEEEFISRCMAELYNEYGQEQSAGICYSQWEDKDKMSEDFKTVPTSDCIERKISAGYNEEDAKQACSKMKPVPEDQQGGVVAQAMARVKFEFPPKAKEKMNDFMARCMGDEMVRGKKPDRTMRGGFCWSEYQNNYIGSIGRSWK